MIAAKDQRHSLSGEVFGVKRMSRPVQPSTRTNSQSRRGFVALLLKALSAFHA